jgi:hypothetical protein
MRRGQVSVLAHYKRIQQVVICPRQRLLMGSFLNLLMESAVSLRVLPFVPPVLGDGHGFGYKAQFIDFFLGRALGRLSC